MLEKRKGRSRQRTPGNLDNSAARGEVCPTRREIVKGSLYLHDTVTPRVYWSATSALAPHLPSPHPPPSLPAGASGHTRRSAANQPCPLWRRKKPCTLKWGKRVKGVMSAWRRRKRRRRINELTAHPNSFVVTRFLPQIWQERPKQSVARRRRRSLSSQAV